MRRFRLQLVARSEGRHTHVACEGCGKPFDCWGDCDLTVVTLFSPTCPTCHAKGRQAVRSSIANDGITTMKTDRTLDAGDVVREPGTGHPVGIARHDVAAGELVSVQLQTYSDDEIREFDAKREVDWYSA